MSEIQKTRLHYVDLAKGLLILFVVYGHTFWMGGANKVSSPVFAQMPYLSDFWYPFFMPAFFILTGYCSNFNKPLHKYLLNNFVTIVLPAFTVIVLLRVTDWSIANVPLKNIWKLGSWWFLITLFYAKIIYWFVNKIPPRVAKVLVPTLMLLSFLGGCALSVYLKKSHEVLYQYWLHTMIFTPFLYAGVLIKRYPKVLNWWWLCGVLYLVANVVFMVIAVPRPRLHSVIDVDYYKILPCLFMSLSGSVALIGLCRKMKPNRVLEFLGRNSLVIYLSHVFILSHIFRATKSWYGLFPGSDYIWVFLTLVSTVLACSLLSWILNLRYVRWLIGKF